MKSMSGPLASLLNSNNYFAKADLYTWTFLDGTIVRVTDADIDLTFGGHTYYSAAPLMERTKVTVSVGVEVDTIDVTISPKAPNAALGITGDLVNGVTWQAAAISGYMDGSELLVETAYIQTWPTVVGTLHVFQGNVSDVFPERASIKVTVKSVLERLAQPFPRNVYQSVCLHTVYDAGCGVAKGSFTATGTVSASPAPTITSFKTGNAEAAGYFDQGVITFTSGANNGLKRTVKSYDPSTGFTFALPLPVAPSAGDTISVFAGCDKTLATCRTKFSNPDRFRGFPWIPNPETAAPPLPGYTKTSGK